MRSFAFAAIALIVGCSSGDGSTPTTSSSSSASSDASSSSSGTPHYDVKVCNGHAELCDRAYTDVTFPGDHDAYATREKDFVGADQTYSMTRQLDDGVRVLHLEIEPNPTDGDKPSLCHGNCYIGHQRLTDGLAEVKKFVDAHEGEVVTLLMETTNVDAAAVAKAMESSGVADYAHRQSKGDAWPTLGQMLTKGERVVAFLSVDGGSAGPHPYLLDRWSFTWETPWDNESLDDFKRCDADRGDAANEIYVVDTYLEDVPVQTPENARRVNVNPFLVERLLVCREGQMRRPNFAMVNYYEVGDLFASVDVLNGFAPEPTFDPASFPPGEGGGGAGGSP